VTLSQQDAGGEEAAIAYTLAALKDWTFLLGPGFIVGWGNGLILGYLMYTSELVPRRLALFGLVGGPLIILSGIFVMFDGGHPNSTLQGIATIPEFIWELGLGIYALIWGFRSSSPLLAGETGARPRRDLPDSE
jgi:peptidoglycan/LPS O-acetylase OafA/YrhL